LSLFLGLSQRVAPGRKISHKLVPTMSGRGKDCELRLAFEPAHILLLVGNGRSVDQGDSGTRRPQDDYDVRTLQPSLAGTQTFGHRSNRHGELNPIGERRVLHRLTELVPFSVHVSSVSLPNRGYRCQPNAGRRTPGRSRTANGTGRRWRLHRKAGRHRRQSDRLPISLSNQLANFSKLLRLQGRVERLSPCEIATQ